MRRSRRLLSDLMMVILMVTGFAASPPSAHALDCTKTGTAGKRASPSPFAARPERTGPTGPVPDRLPTSGWL
jgi:hypothetical protein